MTVRTTVRLPEELLNRAKRKAAAELVSAIRAVMSSGVYLGDSRRIPRERSSSAAQQATTEG